MTGSILLLIPAVSLVAVRFGQDEPRKESRSAKMINNMTRLLICVTTCGHMNYSAKNEEKKHGQPSCFWDPGSKLLPTFLVCPKQCNTTGLAINTTIQHGQEIACQKALTE